MWQYWGLGLVGPSLRAVQIEEALRYGCGVAKRG